jgi:hypothetical protein
MPRPFINDDNDDDNNNINNNNKALLKLYKIMVAPKLLTGVRI